LGASIIAYRTEHGPFTSIDQLDEVSGIGPATMEDLRSQVTV
jgi:competence protein ComEA